MSAEIIDVRSKVGQEAYLNHLRRKVEGKTPEELAFLGAVKKLQISAMDSCLAWMQTIYFPQFTSENWPKPEEIARVQERLIKAMLSQAIETLDFDSANEAEKFMGPDWHEHMDELRNRIKKDE